MPGLARLTVRLAVCVAITAVILQIWVWVAFRPSAAAPLTAGFVGKTWADSSQEFNNRIRANFPIGSSQQRMEAELQRQGFLRQGSAAGQGNGFVRREDNGACNQAAHIHWRSDGKGHLAAVGGEYREEGCL